MSAMAKARAKWSAMGARERLLAGIAMALAVAATADLVVYEPVVAGLGALRKELAQKQEDLAAVTKQRVDLTTELDAIARQHGAATAPSAFLADAKRAGRLWDEVQAAGWVARTQKFFGEELMVLSVASSGVVDGGYHAVYAHAVTVEAITSWDRLAVFLEGSKSLSAMRVDKAEIGALPGGQVRITLRVRILSGEKNWKDAGAVAALAGGAK